MITIKLDEIVSENLQHLVDNKVQERKTLEYKSQLPGNSDEEKKEFLADASSLANTEGGDLIFGIKETAGVPEALTGIEITDIDAQISRLENILRDGLSPRISSEMRSVVLEDGKQVLILRVKASIELPHRVVFRGYDKFYRRNSNGKYPMDVVELRQSFTQSGELIDRIRRFRLSRVADIKAADTPFPIKNSERFMSIHILPLSSFTTSFRLDRETLLSFKEGALATRLAPISASGWDHRINLDGVLVYSRGTDNLVHTYSQLYRDGKLEVVESSKMTSMAEDGSIYMKGIESLVLEYTADMLKLLTELEIQPPFYVYLSLVGVKGCILTDAKRGLGADVEPIIENEILLPEVVIEDPSARLNSLFRPVFDMVWNAAGISRSLSFDNDDNLKV